MRISIRRLMSLTAILFAFSLVAAACGDDDTSAGDDTGDEAMEEGDDTGDEGGDDMGEDISGTVQISGSSTVEPISTRVKELYNEQVSSDVEISVNGPGTSAGFEEFCGATTDINDASRAISDSEVEECGAAGVTPLELKVAFDGIAILVSPDNPLECVSFADLYAVSGPETEGATWEEAQAFAEGAEGADGLGSTSGQTWPTGTIDIIAPGTESGTYGSYIEIVLEDNALARSDIEDEDGAGYYTPETDENGDPVLINSSYAGQPDDNVIIEGIASTQNGFGWVGFAFAEAAGDSVKILEVQDEDGNCVAPSLETIADGSYPVSRSLYIYVAEENIATNDALVSFIDFYLGGAYPDAVENAFGEGVGYVALPDDQLQASIDAWAAATGG